MKRRCVCMSQSPSPARRKSLRRLGLGLLAVTVVASVASPVVKGALPLPGCPPVPSPARGWPAVVASPAERNHPINHLVRPLRSTPIQLYSCTSHAQTAHVEVFERGLSVQFGRVSNSSRADSPPAWFHLPRWRRYRRCRCRDRCRQAAPRCPAGSLPPCLCPQRARRGARWRACSPSAQPQARQPPPPPVRVWTAAALESPLRIWPAAAARRRRAHSQRQHQHGRPPLCRTGRRRRGCGTPQPTRARAAAGACVRAWSVSRVHPLPCQIRRYLTPGLPQQRRGKQPVLKGC